MTESAPSTTSQLFTVRIWMTEGNGPEMTWPGKVQHVPTGAWRYFRDWEDLIVFFETQLVGEQIPYE